MQRPRLLIKTTPSVTRLLASYGDDEILRAVLPPPLALHPRAAPTLLEGLSLWYRRPLCVVLCADGQDASSGLGLCDDFGFANETVHYQVDVLDPARRRRGLGSFRDLRQLDLRGVR